MAAAAEERSSGGRSSEKQPIYLQVAEQISEAIFDGTMSPGEILPTERALSAQHGVSRTTLREALRSLQARGLITGGGRTSPFRTAVAPQGVNDSFQAALNGLVRIGKVALDDLVDLRCALEAASVTRAAQRAQPEQLQPARDAVTRMQDPTITVEDFDEADVRFHLALAEASGNRAIEQFMHAVRESIREHLREAMARAADRRGAIRQLVAEHEAVLNAVEQRDPELAAWLVQRHIRNFYRPLLAHPDDAEVQ